MSTQQKQKITKQTNKKSISNYLEKITNNLNANSNLKKAISEINSLIKAADSLKNEYEIYVVDQNNSASQKVALQVCPSAKSNSNIQKSVVQSKPESKKPNQKNQAPENNNSKSKAQNNSSKQLKEAVKPINKPKSNNTKQPLVSALKKAASQLANLSTKQKEQKQNNKSPKLNSNSKQQPKQNKPKALLLKKSVKIKAVK